MIEFPVVWVDLLPEVRVDVDVNLVAGDTIPKSPLEMSLSNDKGETRVNINKTFERLWNENKIDKTPNLKHVINAAQEGVEVRTAKSDWRSISNLRIEYVVKQTTRIKYFTPSDYKGIKNYLTDDFEPCRLNIGPIGLKRDSSWKEMESHNELPMKSFVFITTEKTEIKDMNSTLGETTVIHLESEESK